MIIANLEYPVKILEKIFQICIAKFQIWIIIVDEIIRKERAMSYNKLYMKALSKGLSLIDLCNKTGISYHTMLRRKNNPSELKVDEIKRICSAIELTDPEEIVDIFLLD